MLGVGVLEGGAMVAVEGGNNCNDAPIPPSVQPCTVRTGRLVGVFLLERSLVRVQGWAWQRWESGLILVVVSVSGAGESRS